jgi:hypothetical protein
MSSSIRSTPRSGRSVPFMTTHEERITRLENALWDLALMTTDGNPARHLGNVDSNASDAAKGFLEARLAIESERHPPIPDVPDHR